MLLHFFKTERISYHIYEFFALNEKITKYTEK